MANLRITSSAFDNGQSIPAKYTCDGANIHPPLVIDGVPQDAESLVLIIEDPDVPERLTADVWDHWVVFNMPANDTEISAGEELAGTHGTGTADNKKYEGPCPPDGMHRYFFSVYALENELEIQEGATKAAVEEAMDGHIIAQAELMGQYDRH